MSKVKPQEAIDLTKESADAQASQPLQTKQQQQLVLTKTEKLFLKLLRVFKLAPSNKKFQGSRIAAASCLVAWCAICVPVFGEKNEEFFITGSIVSLWGLMCLFTFFLFLYRSWQQSIGEQILEILFQTPPWMEHVFSRLSKTEGSFRQQSSKMLYRMMFMAAMVSTTNVMLVATFLFDIFNVPYVSSLFTQFSVIMRLFPTPTLVLSGVGMGFATLVWTVPLVVYLLPSYNLYLRFKHLAQETDKLILKDREEFYAKNIGDLTNETEQSVSDTENGSGESSEPMDPHCCTMVILYDINIMLDEIDSIVAFVNKKLGLYAALCVVIDLYLCLFLVYQMLFSHANIIAKFVGGAWFVFNIQHASAILVPCATLFGIKETLVYKFSLLSVYRANNSYFSGKFLLLQQRVGAMQCLTLLGVQVSWRLIGQILSVFSSGFFLMYNSTS